MVTRALIEDLGTGDLTAQLAADKKVSAQVILKDDFAVLCGASWFADCLYALDDSAQIHWHAHDGDNLQQGQIVCSLTAQSRALLSAERPALNFLQTLSATATQTQRYVVAIRGLSPNPRGCVILDTRKTLPGLRLAQKYAVKMGGGENQRLALWHGILIKENHIVACGGISAALDRARAMVASSAQPIAIQIEVENLHELITALQCGAEHILIDDFSLADMREAVRIAQHHAGGKPPAWIEASGGVSLDNIKAIAQTGVDRISIGGITKHILAIDYSLRILD